MSLLSASDMLSSQLFRSICYRHGYFALYAIATVIWLFMLEFTISVMVVLYVVWLDSKFRLKKELSYSAYYKLMFTEYFNYAFLTKPDDDNRVLSKALVN